MGILTLDELYVAITAILPNATFGEDNDGQLIIYTDMTETETGRIRPMANEGDN